jgi:hypothetical protein
MEPIVSEATAVLSRTPRTLRALLESLPEPWLDASEGPDTFSPRDVLGHLGGPRPEPRGPDRARDEQAIRRCRRAVEGLPWHPESLGFAAAAPQVA